MKTTSNKQSKKGSIVGTSSSRKLNFNSAHKPAKSHILMRQSVKQPETSFKRKIKVVSRADHPDANKSLIALKDQAILGKRDYNLSVKKSVSISHFARSKQSEPMPERPQATPKPAPSPPINNWPKTTADVLERALEHASAHEQTPVILPLKKRRRLARGWLVSIGLLVIVGIFVSQNMTSIRLQLAAAKAGFNASLPRDMPAGYSFSTLKFQSGVVSTTFHSNSSDFSYSITQRTTLWDNQNLQNNFLKATDPKYVTIKSSGLTVFLYGNHDATWLSNGIWYDIESNGALSDNQLIQMANTSS